MIAITTILFDISIPAVRSLKQKRSVIEPLRQKIMHRFNVSVAEIDYQDVWNRSVIACGHISNDAKFSQSYLSKVKDFVEGTAREFSISDYSIEHII